MIKKRWAVFLSVLLLFCFLTGCGEEEQREESGYQIWYMNQEEIRLGYEYKELQAKSAEGLLKEVLEVFREQPQDEELKPALPETVHIDSYTLEHNQLYLDMAEEYLQMSGVCEILCRAALVGASLNVRINTRAMADREYAEDLNRKIDDMLAEYLPIADQVCQGVTERLSKPPKKKG